MKKILAPLLILFTVVGIAVPHVLAQGFVPLAPIPGLTDNVQASQGGLADFLNNLYKFLIGIAAALAVIVIIWSGLEIALNPGNVSKMGESRSRIVGAIFGLILVLSPVLVFSIINPSILNLSLDLPVIGNTMSGTSGQTPPTTTTTPGCTLSSGTTYLLTYSCTDTNTANSYTCPGGFTLNKSGSSSSVYCEDPNYKVTFYVTTDNTGGMNPAVQPFYNQAVPSGTWGKTTLQAFESGCSADGGQTYADGSPINATQITPGEAGSAASCPANSGAPAGAKCVDVQLLCQPSSP
ncbi:MAG: pilin [Minisyncoccia bacterium]